MAILGESVRFGDERGILCRPERATLPLPAVIVLQEIWGLDEHIEDVARRVAAAGYTALAPDLFAVRGERPAPLDNARIADAKRFMEGAPPAVWTDRSLRDQELAKLDPAARARVEETLELLFPAGGRPATWLDDFVPRLREAARWLREDCPAARGTKVAAVGFCMGGGLSIRLACADPMLAGAVVFYGPSPPIERIAQARCPIQGHYAELDARITDGVEPLAQAAREASVEFEWHLYPGARHAFFNDGRPAYDVVASRTAWVRTLEFLRRVTA